MRRFDDLTEQEVLALAIAAEEEDGRIYADFAHLLRADYPDSARVFEDMAVEEGGHRRQLIDAYVARFGEHIPLIRREDVRGFVRRRPTWQVTARGIEAVRNTAREMEIAASRFYAEASARCTDAATRRLLGDLAQAELGHQQAANELMLRHLDPESRRSEDAAARRRFILGIIQPGLVGLMDGSVSTLAPVFAAAFATQESWTAFLVGCASSVGAGISMGFAEALADDGRLSGRGRPLARGLVCGLMTMAGGIGHTLPFLIPAFWTAFALSCLVTLIELATIAWVQWRYMETPPFSAAAKVMLGGGLVLGAGILIGSG